MTQPPDWLSQILVQIHESRQKGGRALVVFDLDSTLFDVSPRTQRILRDFAQEPEPCRRHPQSIEILRNLRIGSKDWGFQAAFERSGLMTHPADFHQAVQRYWLERFFSGDYLHHDRPLDGAVRFVRQVENLGARVVYLTGRAAATMGEASRLVLESHGFPEGELALKPDPRIEDARFKIGWFDSAEIENYDPVYFFENEPGNLIAVTERHPRVRPVFVDTTHSGRHPVAKDWPVVVNFSVPLPNPAD